MQLDALGDDLWVVDGPTAIDLLIVPYPTRMTIVRLRDGGLWVSSPVPTSLADLTELTTLGPVTHLVAATPRHHWRLEPWHALFPEAALWSCRLGPATLGRRSLPATVLRDDTRIPWGDDLDHVVYPGVGFEETTFFHRPTGTLIVEDILQSHTFHPGRSAVNAAIRFGEIAAPGGVPRDIRALTRRAAGRRWAEHVLRWDFDRLIMAHGPVIRDGAKDYVRRAFDWLL